VTGLSKEKRRCKARPQYQGVPLMAKGGCPLQDEAGIGDETRRRADPTAVGHLGNCLGITVDGQDGLSETGGTDRKTCRAVRQLKKG